MDARAPGARRMATTTRRGLGVSSGIAVGQAHVLRVADTRVEARPLPPDADPAAEVARYEAAVARIVAEIRAQLDALDAKAGPDVIPILKAHILLVDEKDVRKAIAKIITSERVTAETAASRVYRDRAERLRRLQDTYLAGRVKDLRDTERRLVTELLGETRVDLATLTAPVVLVAHDLTPSETAGLLLLREKVLGLATEVGGPTSHTAIIARDHGLPAVVGAEGLLAVVRTGDMLVLDGGTGQILVNPDPETVGEARQRAAAIARLGRRIRARLRGLPSETPDGHEVRLCANVDAPEDVPHAVEMGADGVGLFRTEFLVKDGEVPDEEAQLAVYTQAVKALDGRPLTLRTFDFGADKVGPGRRKLREPNPFLGFRSIRYCLANLKLFKAQLRAILRASAHGPVRLMFPMVSAHEELRRAKLVLDEVRKDLEKKKIAFDRKLPVGIMIEVPSAAVVADLLADQADFFSIGTNDLVGYTVAVDRGNQRVASLYRAAHPAVLRLVRGVIDVGVRRGVDVSLCGEMCSDPLYTVLLLGLGLRDWSLAPTLIPEVKRIIRATPMREAEQVAARVAGFHEAAESESYLAERLKRTLAASR